MAGSTATRRPSSMRPPSSWPRTNGRLTRDSPKPAPGARAQWQPSPRYPDPAIRILDPSFAKYRVGSSKVERLATGLRWCEGPVWFGDGRHLLWSDIPNDRIMKWEEETGAVSI